MATTKTTTTRPRCSCGRARRKAATHCQLCLDAAELAAKAKEPARMYARGWRAAGWLCAIANGRVYLVRRDGRGITGDIRSTPIDSGRWSLAVNRDAAPWIDSTTPAAQLELGRIARDCYCPSFPDTGCDFCNGTRLPDGSRGIA